MTVTEALRSALEALEGVKVNGKNDLSRMVSVIGLIEESVKVLEAAESARRESDQRDGDQGDGDQGDGDQKGES